MVKAIFLQLEEVPSGGKSNCSVEDATISPPSVSPCVAGRDISPPKSRGTFANPDDFSFRQAVAASKQLNISENRRYLLIDYTQRYQLAAQRFT
jgi:hypothetical protein